MTNKLTMKELDTLTIEDMFDRLSDENKLLVTQRINELMAQQK